MMLTAPQFVISSRSNGIASCVTSPKRRATAIARLPVKSQRPPWIVSAMARRRIWLVGSRTGRLLGRFSDRSSEGSGSFLPISHHADQLVAVTCGYGTAGRPEDFLDNFTSFIRSNVNKIAALSVVVQRPRELTRAQLRELQLELANQGFTDTALRTAWQQSKNEDIAASIIGFIRQAAIGDPLEPFEDRVHKAIRKIESRGTWTQPQRAWLRRIGEQLVQELVRTKLRKTLLASQPHNLAQSRFFPPFRKPAHATSSRFSAVSSSVVDLSSSSSSSSLTSSISSSAALRCPMIAAPRLFGSMIYATRWRPSARRGP